ncbi:hypothetical protein HKD37_04G009993 [Glycine soja]
MVSRGGHVIRAVKVQRRYEDGLALDPSSYLMHQHTKTGLLEEPSLYVLYRHVAGVIQRRSLLGPVVVSQIVLRLQHVLVTFSYFAAPYHFFAPFFDYLPLLWRPSYTELLLRQRASSPTNSISCPLPLVPFAATADKGPLLLLVVFIVVYIVVFKEDKWGLKSKDELRENYIGRWLKEAGKEIYIAPYLNQAHWQLVVLCPGDNVVVWLCSLKKKPDAAIKGAVNSAMKSVTKTAEGKPPQHGPQWIEAKSHVQTGNYECGCYVMQWIWCIVSGGLKDDWIHNTFMSTTVLYRDRSSINTVSYDGRPQQNTVVETTVVDQDYVYDGDVPMVVVVFCYFYDGVVRQPC